MKLLTIILVCTTFCSVLPEHIQDNTTQQQNATESNPRQEAVDIVAAIADNLADLIILHKNPTTPQDTKQHSIALIKNITEIITFMITNAKKNKTSTTKQYVSYDTQELEIQVNAIVQQIIEMIHNSETMQ